MAKSYCYIFMFPYHTKKNFSTNFFLFYFFCRNMIFHKILVCFKFVVTKVPQQMYCKFVLQKFLVKVFFSQIIFSKISSCHQICTHSLNLVFCVCLFVCLSVCQCLCKSAAIGGPTKFWSKVLAPVLASDDTILETFYLNNLNFSVFFEAIKLLSLGQKSCIRETKNLSINAASSTAGTKLLSLFF